MAGDAETAVAVIEVAPELDAGPILAEQRIPIGEHDDAGAVRRAALELGVPLLERALLGASARAQDEQGITYARKIEAAEPKMRNRFSPASRRPRKPQHDWETRTVRRAQRPIEFGVGERGTDVEETASNRKTSSPPNSGRPYHPRHASTWPHWSARRS